jgi:lysophospholipase L1-like esterase
MSINRTYYVPGTVIPTNIDSREDSKSTFCCLAKGYSPPPFSIVQDEDEGTIKVIFEPNPFTSTCQCRIECTAEATGATDSIPDIGKFCPEDEDFEVILSSQVFSTSAPTLVTFTFEDASGNTSSVDVNSIVNVIPRPPLAEIATSDGDRRTHHIIAVPLYSQSLVSLRGSVTQYQIERYVRNRTNRHIWVDWTDVGGTIPHELNRLDRTHWDRDILTGVTYGYRVRFRSTVDNTSRWSEWLTPAAVDDQDELPEFSYEDSPFSWGEGSEIEEAAPTSTGGPITSYSIVAGSLPDGVSLDPDTGVISGTPASVASAANVTIRAIGPAGIGHTVITFTVYEAPEISYSGSPFTWTVGTSIGNEDPTSTGGLVTSYAVQSGTLPSGISLNTSTGRLSGTPTAAYEEDDVTIRATGPGGTDDAIITITVEVPTPDTLPNIFDWWQHDYAGSLFTERSSPSTPTTDGGVVGTWRGRVNSTDIPAETDAKRPIWYDDYGIQFFWQTDGGTVNAKMLLTGLSFDRAAFSGAMIIEWPGTAYTALDFDSASEFAFMPGQGNISSNPKVQVFDGASFISTTKTPTCRRSVIAWVNSPSGLKVWVNESEFSSTALSSVTLDRIVLGQFNGGAASPVTIKELVLCDAAESDSDMTNLRTYMRSRAGTLGDGNLICIVGDSLSIGVGSEDGTAWHRRLTARPLSEWRSYAYDGAFLFTSQPITKENLVTAGSGYTEKIAVLWIGTNDINQGFRTGLQLYNDAVAYSSHLRSNGWQVVICLLQDLENNDTEAQDFNTRVNAGSSNFDAIADLRTSLPDHTDTTKYTSDKTHLKNAGYILVATAVDAAIATL